MDSAGATHELIDWCRDGRIHFSVGYDVTGPVRAGIAEVPEDAWVSALDQDGTKRPNGQVAELTNLVDLSRWPEGTRLICRRERAHPGAQLSLIDHDGYRFQTFLTDQPDPDIAVLERRQRQRARAEDHIRRDKDTGLAKLPFRDFQMNQVWVELVLIAHDLIRWTRRCYSKASSPKPNQNACATAYYTSPLALPFTAAQQGCASKTTGRGDSNSSTHS